MIGYKFKLKNSKLKSITLGMLVKERQTYFGKIFPTLPYSMQSYFKNDPLRILLCGKLPYIWLTSSDKLGIF